MAKAKDTVHLKALRNFDPDDGHGLRIAGEVFDLLAVLWHTARKDIDPGAIPLKDVKPLVAVEVSEDVPNGPPEMPPPKARGGK